MRTIGIIGIIPWIAFIALLSNSMKVKKTEKINGVDTERYTAFFAISVFLPIILWAGFREGRGYVDTNAYIRFFKEIPTNYDSFTRYLNKNSEDPGFTIYCWVIKSVFGQSYRYFLLITAIIQCVAVALFYRKYSPNFLISAFLFVASTEYFSWIFNGLRQFMAVSIILLGFRFFTEKKYFRYFVFVALAVTFHFSAIIMIPISVIAIGKAWNKKTMIAIVVAIVALVATAQFTDLLDTSLENTQYSNAVSDWVESDDDGTNPIRVAVYLVPTIIAFFGRKKIESCDDPILNISVNMSIVSSSIWLVSMVTSGIMMGRLPIYASVFNYILLPYELEYVFDNKSKKIVTYGMIIMYLMFYYYQFHFSFHVI